MHRLLSLILVCALLVGGSALVAEAKNVTKTPSSSHHQYSPKPGCGPWKTDGLAGKSGVHDGQPPKAPDRQDCPIPKHCQSAPGKGQSVAHWLEQTAGCVAGCDGKASATTAGAGGHGGGHGSPYDPCKTSKH